jgi:hypothetical protein
MARILHTSAVLSSTALVALAGAAMLVISCDSGPYKPPALHQYTQDYDFTIQPDQAPPHARDDVHYAITILDRKTRQPIENGEGQLFAGKPIDDDAPTGPQSKTYDGLAYGPEVGVYHAKLNFVISGTWAVAIRFRRDSLHALERTDWMQDVIAERPSTIP